MDYVHIPVDWNQPSKDALQRFLTEMQRVKDRSVFVHCALNARASAFVYLYLVTRESTSTEREYSAMEEIWERNPGYELRSSPQWVKFIDQAAPRAGK